MIKKVGLMFGQSDFFELTKLDSHLIIYRRAEGLNC